MNTRNEFSCTLEQMMTMADVKNYTLAQALQYDVSYISKWVSGRMLPAERNVEKIIRKIVQCIIESMSEETHEKLLQEYHTEYDSELENALYDNLNTSYNYVKNLKKSTGSDIAPETTYFAEMTLPQFASHMMHPSLRRVKALELVALMDLFAMEHEHRMLMTRPENNHLPIHNVRFPEVKFALIVNLDSEKQNAVSDAVFMINLITNLAYIDFEMYASSQAAGRILLSVKESFAISGMLMDDNHCMAVTISENTDTCTRLYQKMKLMCTKEMLLFRKTTMQEMLDNFNYIQSTLSANLNWLIGHFTEHFLPADLFTELLEQVDMNGILIQEENTDEKLTKMHNLSSSILNEEDVNPVNIAIYESALNDFAVSGNFDFFNKKIELDMEQRLRCIQNILDVFEKNPNVHIRIIRSAFSNSFQYAAKHSLFLSDMISYLRMDIDSYHDNIVQLNASQVKSLFFKFYNIIWSDWDAGIISDRKEVMAVLKHVKQSIKLLSRV